MNTATNTTTAAPAATSPIEQLITAHIEAVAHHNRAFDLIDWKIATEDEFGDTISPVDDAIIALCAARPFTTDEAKLKRDYLNSELFPVLDCNLGMTKRAVIALLDAAGEPEARPAEAADQPVNLKGLMAALSVELMRWNGGGHRAVIYPANSQQPSSLQDILLMPEEPGARPGSPSMVARKIAKAQDSLDEAQSLNVATMLATEGVDNSPAIQAVARAVEVNINVAREQLDAIREALA